MDRYVNFSPGLFNGNNSNNNNLEVVDGAVYKKRTRVERSPSALSDGAAAARAQTDVSDSSINNQTADAGKKGKLSRCGQEW
jgi:hypothetical protein